MPMPLSGSEAGFDFGCKTACFIHVNDHDLKLVSIRTRFRCETQEGLYQNKVNSSLTFIQTPDR